MLSGDERESLRAGGRERHFVATGAEIDGHGPKDGHLVIHDQHSAHRIQAPSRYLSWARRMTPSWSASATAARRTSGGMLIPVPGRERVSTKRPISSPSPQTV